MLVVATLINKRNIDFSSIRVQFDYPISKRLFPLEEYDIDYKQFAKEIENKDIVISNYDKEKLDRCLTNGLLDNDDEELSKELNTMYKSIFMNTVNIALVSNPEDYSKEELMDIVQECRMVRLIPFILDESIDLSWILETEKIIRS